jgi:hypothetical protein
MSHHYYRYNVDDAPIDLQNDEIYDYVLEREALKDLDLVGPRCYREMSGAAEHFGNMKGKRGKMMKHVLLVIVVLVVLCLLYCLCNDNIGYNLSPKNYIARLNY